MFKKGQQVFCLLSPDGRIRIAIQARFRRYRDNMAVVKDNSGEICKLPQHLVFATREAMEAAVQHLAVVADTETGKITTFPQ